MTLAALQGAFDDDRLVVHFQPQVSLRTGEVVGVEALVRWQHADGALIPPQMFVEIAEAADLAQALTWRVIEKVATVATVLPDISISINLPPVSLTDVTFPGSGHRAPGRERRSRPRACISRSRRPPLHAKRCRRSTS